MKVARHQKILQLIDEHTVETQEDLTRLLKESGIYVTQATVSRDIRELKLIKVLGENGSYKYAAYYNETGVSADERLGDVFRESVLTIDYSMNIVCIHTIPGMGNAAGVVIDSMKINDIIGSVAGDDTLFVLVRNEEKAKKVMQLFKKMLKRGQ